MKTKFNQFINETQYVSLKSNLYNFFEDLDIDINLIEENQMITIELNDIITGKEVWFESFISLCNFTSYDKYYIDNNKVCIYKSLGLLNQPNEYTQFDD